MDPNRLKEAYQKLELLDERLRYKVTPRSALTSPSTDQVDARLRDLATYTLELKDVLKEFMLAFARARKPGE